MDSFEASKNFNYIKRGPFSWLLLLFAILVSRIFIKIKVQGKENIPNSGSFIIAANHLSYFDGLWIMSIFPLNKLKNFHAIAGSDLWTDYGLLGRLMMRVGSAIPLDRKGSPITGILSAKRALVNNNILLIHPEGTRSHNGYLSEIHGGAALLSRRAQVPLLPIYLDGAYEIFGRHHSYPSTFSKFFKRKELVIRIASLINPDDYKSSRDMTDVLKDKLTIFDNNRLTESERVTL